jgi:hypothetical protein
VNRFGGWVFAGAACIVVGVDATAGPVAALVFGLLAFALMAGVK